MSDEPQGPEAGAPEAAAPEAPGVDLSGIEEAIGRFDGRFNAIEQALSQQPTQPEAPQDPLQDLYGYADPLGLNVPQAQGEQDDTAALQALAAIGDQRAQAIINQSVNPQMQAMERQLAEFRAEKDLQDLKSQYPKLGSPEVHDAVAQIVTGWNLPPGVPVTKDMVATAYRAWEADQMTTGEGSVSTQHAELENPAGAGPEGSETDWNDRLSQNAASSKGNAFWGLRS